MRIRLRRRGRRDRGWGRRRRRAQCVAVSGVTAAVRGRSLLAAGMIREWGASGTLRIGPGADGRCARVRAGGGVRGTAAAGTPRSATAWAVPAGLGTAMPFTGVGLAGDARTWRAGVRWQVAPEASLGLQGTRTESAGGSEHGLRLHGSLRW